MSGYLLELPDALPGYRWASPEEIREQYSVPTAFRYYLKQI